MNLVYTHDVFSYQIHGGMSRYFVELIKHIRPMDADSAFQVLGGLYINEHLKEIPGRLGIKVPPVKYTGIFRRSIDNFIQKIWIKINNPTIIHQTYYSDFVFKKHAKVVLTVPDVIHELYPESFSDKGVTSVLKKRCCDRADKIIVISNVTKKDLVNALGINPQKVHVIYLANPLERVKPDLKTKIPYSNYILFVGDRHGYKNFSALIQAYAQSENTQKNFQLVCFGGGSFSPDEWEIIHKLGIENKVKHVCGNDRLLALYYKNARALIYPSLYEGFGLPPLEAMSYSCPVICSNAASIPEVVGDAGVYFDPKSTENMQAVLDRVLLDNSLLNELRVRGTERNKKFSWDKCAQETFEIYRSLDN